MLCKFIIFIGQVAFKFSFTSKFFVNVKFHSAQRSETGSINKMNDKAVTQPAPLSC